VDSRAPSGNIVAFLVWSTAGRGGASWLSMANLHEGAASRPRWLGPLSQVPTSPYWPRHGARSPPDSGTPTRAGRAYLAFVDMSGGSNDSAVLCIGYMDGTSFRIVRAVDQGVLC